MSQLRSMFSRRNLPTALAAAAVAAVASVGGAYGYTVTAPTSVPTTYTDSSPVLPLANLIPGLSASLWTISPTTNLGNYNNAGLDGPGNYSGSASLQGMANEEMLAQNGTITIPPSATNSSGTYYATPLFSWTDTGINTSGYLNQEVGGTVGFFLEGASNGGDPGTIALLPANVPTSVANTSWQDVLFDQQGYVYVSQANSSYNFNTVNGIDDAGEVLLGGNGKVGSGTVVFFRNINGIGGFGSTVPSPSSYTVTFSQAGYYPFEIFYAHTWGNAELNLNFTPVGNAPALGFYTATPEPASVLILAAGAAGLALLGRRIGRA